MKYVLVTSAVCAFTVAAQAQFFGLSVGGRGVSVRVGLPVCAPAPVYVAPPVYTAPVVYSTPGVVYAAPAPVLYPAYGPAVVVGVGPRCYGGYPCYGHGYYAHGYYGHGYCGRGYGGRR